MKKNNPFKNKMKIGWKNKKRNLINDFLGTRDLNSSASPTDEKN